MKKYSKDRVQCTSSRRKNQSSLCFVSRPSRNEPCGTPRDPKNFTPCAFERLLYLQSRVIVIFYVFVWRSSAFFDDKNLRRGLFQSEFCTSIRIIYQRQNYSPCHHSPGSMTSPRLIVSFTLYEVFVNKLNIHYTGCPRCI